MNARTLYTAMLVLSIGGTATAQTASEPNAAPMPLQDGSMSTATGTEIGGGAATGVPGVGLDSGETTEGAGATKGPGGLQNGVGGEGTLAPSTTGANNDIVDTPAAGEPGDGGIALPVEPGATAN
ncbi:hypothetical protein ASG43_12435 [Aureimonas sp. Leaf454]|uniref:hypothetical protein n=1 Tax=Aureimonas sp. Leaf454 TaxID=1736381 RepID=UPI0006F63E9D|nr:hypothetical protein [Aureimonas sp. Leaf454]KQT45107.1 hypothetical protein ASG43_12435 [Aureimonas sp. Leaf454]